jgi:hypothetical protein
MPTFSQYSQIQEINPREYSTTKQQNIFKQRLNLVSKMRRLEKCDSHYLLAGCQWRVVQKLVILILR